MPRLRGQEFSGRAVVRNGITERLERAKFVPPIVSRTKLAAHVEVGLVFVLQIVQAVGRRLPYVDRRIRNWLTARAGHGSTYHHRLAGGPLRRSPRFRLRYAFAIKGAKQARIGRVPPVAGMAIKSTSALTPSVSDRRMNSLRFSSVMWPAATRKSIRDLPFVGGKADLAHEVVEMPQQRWS